MFSLMPREKTFFDLFQKSAQNVHEGAKALQDLLANFTDVENKVHRIKNIEHAGDELTHHTFERLNKTFITPLDREDIHELTSRLDDVLDLIDTASNRMFLYRIEKPTDDARALVEVLVKATAILVDAFGRLGNLKDPDAILRCCIDIHTQENEGDRIEQHALVSLFDNATSPIDIIKWKDIYGDLEAACDKCEDVANVLESIVLKNA